MLSIMATTVRDARSIAHVSNDVHSLLIGAVNLVSTRLMGIHEQCKEILKPNWAPLLKADHCLSTEPGNTEGKCPVMTGIGTNRIDIRRGVLEAAEWVCSRTQAQAATGTGTNAGDDVGSDPGSGSSYVGIKNIAIAELKALERLQRVTGRAYKAARQAPGVADEADVLKAGLETQLLHMVKITLERELPRYSHWYWQGVQSPSLV